MHNRLQITFFLSLFVGALLSVLYVFRFYLSPILFGVAFAIVFHPFYKWMLKRLGVRGIASALVVLLVLAVVFLPLSFLGVKVFQDAVEAYSRFVSGREPSDVFGVIICFL